MKSLFAKIAATMALGFSLASPAAAAPNDNAQHEKIASDQAAYRQLIDLIGNPATTAKTLEAQWPDHRCLTTDNAINGNLTVCPSAAKHLDRARRDILQNPYDDANKHGNGRPPLEQSYKIASAMTYEENHQWDDLEGLAGNLLLGGIFFGGVYATGKVATALLDGPG